MSLLENDAVDFAIYHLQLLPVIDSIRLDLCMNLKLFSTMIIVYLEHVVCDDHQTFHCGSFGDREWITTALLSAPHAIESGVANDDVVFVVSRVDKQQPVGVTMVL